MREVFTSSDSARVGLFHSMLEGEGVPCFVRRFNDAESGSVVFWPALCVVQDGDYERARELLARMLAEPSAGAAPDWRCAQCEEEVPGTFGSCWQCDTLKPDPTANV